MHFRNKWEYYNIYNILCKDNQNYDFIYVYILESMLNYVFAISWSLEISVSSKKDLKSSGFGPLLFERMQ